MGLHLFDTKQLFAISEANKSSYNSAQPFPHKILDNLFNSKVLSLAASAFPPPEDSAWYRYHNPLEKKLATNRLELLPPLFRDIFLELNSLEFIRFLENLSGIPNLIPDPGLNGGGLHRIEQGGKLDVHLDYNYHPHTRLDRRLNVLIYLNQDWEESYGGHIELWESKDAKNLSQQISKTLPVFNRTLIFSTSDAAYHGHPEPLTCPKDRSRKSLAVYYYTNGRAESEITDPHSTVFKARPGDPKDSEIQKLRDTRAKGRLVS